MAIQNNYPQTRRTQTPDQVLPTTGAGFAEADSTRRKLFLSAAVLLAVIVVAVVYFLVQSHRSETAENLFGNAMQVYQTPVANPAQPAEPGVKTYATAADRAKDANPLFLAVANQYGSTDAGKNARYFAGVTYMEEGQNQSAEDTLKKVADSWDKQLSSLAKFTLAGLYRQTGRDAQAIDLYNQLTAKPTTSVPAASAQIALAELYAGEGKTEQSRKIYAQLKDKDKDAKGVPGVGSTIASQKLNPTAPAAPQAQ